MAKTASSAKRYQRVMSKIKKMRNKWEQALAACEKKKDQIDRKFSKIDRRYDAQLTKLSKK